MPSIRTLIIEDEPLARQIIREFAADFPSLEIVGEADDGFAAASLIDKIEPQLVFLDVRLPELSGLEVLRRVRQPPPAVIFTTAFDDYAVTAFEFAALDYLLKPFGREHFARAARRVERFFENSGRQTLNQNLLTRLFVRDYQQRIVPLSVDEIVWLETDGDYTIIHAAGRKFSVNLTLKEFSRRLDANKFLRVHRSAMVNVERISEIEEADRRLFLHLDDGAEVQASRRGSLLVKKLIA